MDFLMSLTFISKDKDIGFSIVNSTVPKHSMAKTLSIMDPEGFPFFEHVIRRDQRIPQETSGGVEVNSSISQYKGAKMWMPHQSQKNSYGVALVPRALMEDNSYLDTYHACAFQGKDHDGVFLSGLWGYNQSDSPTMQVIFSGRGVSESQLEDAVKLFFENTQQKEVDLDPEKKRRFEEGYQKIIDTFDKFQFHRNGLFTYIVLFVTGVGDSINSATQCEIKRN